jgi:hypothetical protein
MLYCNFECTIQDKKQNDFYYAGLYIVVREIKSIDDDSFASKPVQSLSVAVCSKLHAARHESRRGMASTCVDGNTTGGTKASKAAR